MAQQQEVTHLAPVNGAPVLSASSDFITALDEVVAAEDKLASTLSHLGQPAYNAIRDCRAIGAQAKYCASRMRTLAGERT